MAWWDWQQDMDDLWDVVRGMSGRLGLLERDYEELYHQIQDLRILITQNRDQHTTDSEVLRKHVNRLHAIGTDLKSLQIEIGDIARSRSEQLIEVSKASSSASAVSANPMFVSPPRGPVRKDRAGRPTPSCAPYLRCQSHSWVIVWLAKLSPSTVAAIAVVSVIQLVPTVRTCIRCITLQTVEHGPRSSRAEYTNYSNYSIVN